MSNDLGQMLDQLRQPFHPSQVQWLPGAVKGERALAIAYADLRAYMNRLDEVCGDDWSVAYEPWGADRIICRMTIGGVMRSSTGETTNESEKSEIGGTVAEAQAFKRAAAMFGLGRYLYNLPSGWADFDPKTKKFTDKAKAKLTGILVQHYRRANDGKGEMADIFNEGEPEQEERPASKPAPSIEKIWAQFNALGEGLYGDNWGKVRERNTVRISGGKVSDSVELSAEQLGQLVEGMQKLKANRLSTNQTSEAA